MAFFETDFDDLICARFGKTKTITPEDKIQLINATEEFAVKSGLKEINKMKYDITALLEKYEASFLSEFEPLSEDLEKFLKSLKNIERILAMNFDTKKFIKKHGVETYHQIVKYRRDLIDVLKHKYSGVCEREE